MDQHPAYPHPDAMEKFIDLSIKVYDSCMDDAIRDKFDVMARSGMGTFAKGFDWVKSALADSTSGASFSDALKTEINSLGQSSALWNNLRGQVSTAVVSGLAQKIPIPVLGSLVALAAEKGFMEDYRRDLQNEALNEGFAQSRISTEGVLKSFHSPDEAAKATADMFTQYTRLMNHIRRISSTGPEPNADSITEFPFLLAWARQLASGVRVNLYAVERYVAVMQDRLNRVDKAIVEARTQLRKTIAERMCSALQGAYSIGRVKALTYVVEQFNKKGQIPGVESSHAMEEQPIVLSQYATGAPVQLAARLAALMVFNATARGFNANLKKYYAEQDNLGRPRSSSIQGGQGPLPRTGQGGIFRF